MIVDAASARALVARCILGEADAPERVGDVALRSHQRDGVDRLRAIIAEHGGALLADEVGLGKTFVAASLACGAARPLVVAPAALRAMWEHALRATKAPGTFASYEALSRGREPAGPFDFVILDEAHHARSPGTRRYELLARLTTGARVLLITATPIHNSRGDLGALLALFLGARAWTLDDDALARCIVRREREDVTDAGVPQVADPRWLTVGDDGAILEGLVALPPPLPPVDGGDGGALVTWTLARQWASSHGAFVAALRRRLARATVLDAALAEGRHLGRAELASWLCDEEAVQLALPGLLAECTEPAASPRLRRSVEAHAAGVRALLARARSSAWTDAERAQRLRELRAAHPHEKIVAFTQFADTVRALFSEMRTERGIGALTAQGGRVAGGRLSRFDTIARFSPRSVYAAPPREAERITLLLTTDILSEGLGLEDASVVVHLDLPWTPARIEQRVGRSRRLGAPHACTTVYALAPPASAEALLRVEERLRAKLRAARRTVGIAGTILPCWAPAPGDESAARRRQRVAQALARWRTATALPPRGSGPILAGARTRAPCVLALVRDGDTFHLAASCDALPLDDSTSAVLDAVEALGGDSAEPSADLVHDALRLAEQWIAQRAARRASGLEIPLHAPARRLAMRRIAAIAASAPHHRRPALATLAAHARLAVTRPYGIGAERVLDRLVASSLPDEAWLRALGAFADLHAPRDPPDPRAMEVVLVLVGVAP